MEDETIMDQEDQTQNHSNSGSGSGGRSCRKPKQKKVPQRGLGVAQLEKIRLEDEEQQKINAASVLPSPCSVPSTIPSCLHLPIQNFHPSPPGSVSPLSLEHMDAKVSSTVPLGNSGGFEADVSVFPRLSYNEFDFEKEIYDVDPGLPFLPYFPYESNSNNPIWPLPNLMGRTMQYPQPSSPMGNVSSRTSTTTTTTPVPYFSIEPPSNQNYSGSGVPMRPPEKMIGMKRPYPFSMDFPHMPTSSYKVPTIADMRTNATTLCGNGNGFNFDAGNSTFREVPSCSSSISEPILKRSNIEREDFNGDFLTLAPPSPTSCPPSKFKSPPTFLAFHNQQYPEFESPSSQENVEDQIPLPPVYRRFNQQQQPFYSFIPPAAKEAQIGQTTARVENGNEVGETDLNLKL